MNLKWQLLLFSLLFLSLACNNNDQKNPGSPAAISEAEKEVSESDIKAQALETMKKHLDAVTNKDLVALESTLSPNREMQLILPQYEISNTVKEFMDYHKEWFAIPDWTFETTILNSEIGLEMGMVVVEIIYREPKRDGVPYFNRMIVSYDLKRIDGQWYVIKDHASSVEKSTDQKE